VEASSGSIAVRKDGGNPRQCHSEFGEISPDGLLQIGKNGEFGQACKPDSPCRIAIKQLVWNQSA
jgi:hypothetical protein